MKDKVVFRWGADTMVYSLVGALRLRRETHTFCASVDIRKAFATCWVEATLVRLFQVGETGGMWRTIDELPLWHSFPGSDWFRRLPSMGGLWYCSRSRALAPAVQSLGEQSCSYHLSLVTWREIEFML